MEGSISSTAIATQDYDMAMGTILDSTREGISLVADHPSFLLSTTATVS